MQQAVKLVTDNKKKITRTAIKTKGDSRQYEMNHPCYPECFCTNMTEECLKIVLPINQVYESPFMTILRIKLNQLVAKALMQFLFSFILEFIH